MATGRRITVEFLGDDRSLSRAAGQAEGRMSKFGSKLKSIGKVAGLGLAAGLGLGAKALYDMTKGAAEDQAAQVKLAQTLKNTTGATDDQVASVEDWISAQGKALGVADDDLRPAMQRLAEATGDVGKAQELTSLAMDISAGTGKSLKAVSEALAKAQMGNVGALSRYGIATRDAKGEMLSFDEVTKKASKTFEGQASKQAETLSGKMGRLKLIMAEAGEEIGAKLIPVVTKMADWFLAKGLPAIEAFGGYLQRVLPPIFDKIRAVIAQFSGDGSGKLTKFINDVKQVWNDGVTIVTRLWEMFGKNIVEFLKGWVDSILTIVSGLWDVVRGIFKTFSALLKGDWKGVWKGLQLIFKGFGKILLGLVKNVWNTIQFAFKNAGVVLKKIFGGIWEGIKNVARAGLDWIVGRIKALPGMLKDLGGLFVSAGKWLIGKFFDGLKKLGDLGVNIGKDLLNGIIGAINSGITAINDIIPDSIGVGPVSINLPNDPFPTIPELAKGGIVKARRGGTLALIGEGGHDEAVVPLSGPHAPGRGRMAGAERPILVQLVLDNKVIEQALIRRTRETGRPLQVKTL